MTLEITKALRRVQQRVRSNVNMSTYNVILTSTSHSEMTVKARSPEEAREQAAIQLASMGWLEWTVNSAWKV